MKVSFSTLACPDWTLRQIIQIAAHAGYDGLELRFLEGEDSLWKLPVFQGRALASSKRALQDNGLTISCMDTSCRFHSPDTKERARWLAEGERMGDLAAELGAPGLRVFGDSVQPGADRTSTQGWIADGIRNLAESSSPKGVEVWLETHGDFASADDTSVILVEAACTNVGVIWDPANCLVEAQETPRQGAAKLGGKHSARAYERPSTYRSPVAARAHR